MFNDHSRLHPMSGIGAAFALMQRERSSPNEEDLV